MLWKIEGFDSEDPPPPPSTAPTAHDQSRTTRSAFAPASAPAQWMRLLQFETKNCNVQFFLRFSLHHAPEQHPVLCFCNARNEILMWDLTRLTAYQDFIQALRDPDRDPATKIQRPVWLIPAHHKTKVGDGRRDAEAEKLNAAAVMRPVGHKDPFEVEKILLSEYSANTVEIWTSRYDISNPHRMIKPHKTDNMTGPTFVGRQVAWSPDGCWCVVVGSRNSAMILQRWGKGGRNSVSRQNSRVPSEVQSRQGTAAVGGSEAPSASTSFAQPDAVM